MKEIQEIKNDIMLLKNLGNISKEVELVLLRKLTSLEEKLSSGVVINTLPTNAWNCPNILHVNKKENERQIRNN